MNTLAKKRNSLKQSIARIHRSQAELACALVLHYAAILAIMIAALPFIIKQLLVVSLSVSMAYFCHRWRLMPTKRWVHQHECWCIKSDNTKDVIIGCHYWSRFCVVLNVESQSRWCKRYHTIFWDACSVDDFRHIKLVSRYGLKSE